MMLAMNEMMAMMAIVAVATNACFSIIFYCLKKTTNYTNDANCDCIVHFVSVMGVIRS